MNSSNSSAATVGNANLSASGGANVSTGNNPPIGNNPPVGGNSTSIIHDARSNVIVMNDSPLPQRISVNPGAPMPQASSWWNNQLNAQHEENPMSATSVLDAVRQGCANDVNNPQRASMSLLF